MFNFFYMFKRAYYFSKKGLVFVHLALDYKMVFLLILYNICESYTIFYLSFITNNLTFTILEQLIYKGCVCWGGRGRGVINLDSRKMRERVKPRESQEEKNIWILLEELSFFYDECAVCFIKNILKKSIIRERFLLTMFKCYRNTSKVKNFIKICVS